MAEEREHGTFLDIEKELTCSICTDVLFQPLTLLDCLHTFCGSCLKEWFAWQATSATQHRRRPNQKQPYTCPACRESVRGTKADWRLTTLLEGFLKANPDRGKTEEEKEEMRQHYKIGENVIPEVVYHSEEHDSEDERLMDQVREMSMAGVDPEAAARRRAERQPRTRDHRRRQDGTQQQQHLPLTEARLRERDGDEHRVEHQSSLRSLLSASPVDSHDVQQEILQSIYSEGLLDGIDLDNLTTEQEEELTERIAEAYRRRQRRRDRSSNRERRQQNSRSPQPPPAPTETHRRNRSRTGVESERRTTPPRSRPPISRPHVFEQSPLESPRDHRRNTSATSQRSTHAANPPPTQTPAQPIRPAARSSTDLDQRPRTAEADRRRVSGNARSSTDPDNAETRTRRTRASSSNTRDTGGASRPSNNPTNPIEASRQQPRPTNNSSPSLVPTPALIAPPAPSEPNPQTIRPALSAANFAPEPVTQAPIVRRAPSVKCDRCEKPEIQYDLHYHCPWCRNGHFDLCISCYREGKGCEHWYGFGYMAYERWDRLAPPEGWPANFERPHVLSPRRYLRHSPPPLPETQTTSQLVAVANNSHAPTPAAEILQEGAFCETCHAFANDAYWYCAWCLEGAWGFCTTCLERGAHCTHPLLPTAHISTLHSNRAAATTNPATQQRDPTSPNAITQLPHLRPDSYTISSPPATDCDLCRRPIAPIESRFHCYACSQGDYDVCSECYDGLVATGKIARLNGAGGWRRCLAGHRMAVVGYYGAGGGSASASVGGGSGGGWGGLRRVTLRGPVGGWRLKESGGDGNPSTAAATTTPAALTPGPPATNAPNKTPNGGVSNSNSTSNTNTSNTSNSITTHQPPSDTSLGLRCLASWSRFPGPEVQDELGFPKNVEIREVEEINPDWYLGVYAGKVGLFPSNHVRRLG